MDLPVCNPKVFALGNHCQGTDVDSGSWFEKEKNPHCVQNVWVEAATSPKHLKTNLPIFSSSAVSGITSDGVTPLPPWPWPGTLPRLQLQFVRNGQPAQTPHRCLLPVAEVNPFCLPTRILTQLITRGSTVPTGPCPLSVPWWPSY